MTETEIPALTGTQVLIQNEFAGMCHSDLHLWEGRHICSRAGALPARALTCPRVADQGEIGGFKVNNPRPFVVRALTLRALRTRSHIRSQQPPVGWARDGGQGRGSWSGCSGQVYCWAKLRRLPLAGVRENRPCFLPARRNVCAVSLRVSCDKQTCAYCKPGVFNLCDKPDTQRFVDG